MNKRGFTLIELLLVMSIVSVLAAISYSKFSQYKGKSFDTQAVSDLKAGMIAEEAFYADNMIYVSCADPTTCEAALPNFRATREPDGSSGMSNFSFVATGQEYTASASHNAGLKNFAYDSASGEISSTNK